MSENNQSKGEVQGATRRNMYMFYPEDLVLVVDPKHPLFDKRALEPPDEWLARNIVAKGVLEPILVQMDGTKALVVAGRRRTKAAVLANQMIKKEGGDPIRVACIIKKGEDKDLFGMVVAENEQRKGDSPLARAVKANKMRDLGASDEEIMNSFGWSTKQSLDATIGLLDLDVAVKREIEAGTITATAAAQLIPLSKEDQKEKLAELLQGGGKITVAKARAKVRKKRGKTANANPAPNKREIRKLKEALSNLPRGELYWALSWVLGDVDNSDLAGMIKVHKDLIKATIGG